MKYGECRKLETTGFKVGFQCVDIEISARLVIKME